MVFILDNYDSFTYNLVQFIGETGRRIEVRRNDEVSVDDVLALGPEAVVISPGPGTPADAGISIPLVTAMKGRCPVLGVCLGHQSIAEAFGGRVVRAVPVHGKVSAIRHDGRTLFRNLETTFEATRYHSLVVDRASLPDCLEVTAWTEDGTIMGIRHREDPVEGLQFHPESILTSEGKRILSNFLNLS
ncbi:MAG: aminodeoxychorismate/anthranilate synthase component II [bacterium]|nr:aminodeoxychorismate/anthranilate synthase component II [bacterium]